MPEAARRPALPRKFLGKTGVEVTTVGIGTAWIGRSTQDAPLDEDLAVQTIWAALENGVNLIDTAALYLDSMSERMVARALRERPDLAKGVIVETKTCRLPDGSDYSYEGTMRRVAGNLERLAVERIELLYIHDPPKEAFDTVMGPNGALAALRKLQNDGVVGHIGVASNYPEDNTPYIETGEFAMAVVPDAYSLLSQTATERIFPAAEKFGMGIVVATPLERGILATGVRPGVDYFARKFSSDAQNQVRKMEAICANHGVSILAVALQYVTRHPAVTTSIPGGRTPAEAAANALAGREIIPAALWAEIEPLVRSWDILAPQT